MKLTFRQRIRAAITGEVDAVPKHVHANLFKTSCLFVRGQERYRVNNVNLQARVDALEPALAECVETLRQYARGKTARCSEAYKTIKRIQIPDNELPTEGYPNE